MEMSPEILAGLFRACNLVEHGPELSYEGTNDDLTTIAQLKALINTAYLESGFVPITPLPFYRSRSRCALLVFS